MAITTSYFAVQRNLYGTKVSIARFTPVWAKREVDEILTEFAPSPQLLRAYKKGKMGWAEYKKRYIEEQRDHYRESAEDFKGLLERATLDDVVLLCYERFEGPHTKCHRLILYDLLKKVAEKEESDVLFIDETPYDNARKNS